LAPSSPNKSGKQGAEPAFTAGLGDLTPVPDGWVQPVLFSAGRLGLASLTHDTHNLFGLFDKAVLLKGSAWHGEPGAMLEH